MAAANLSTLSATDVTKIPEFGPRIRWTRMIESSVKKPISTNIQRYCLVRLRKSSMAHPRSLRVVGWPGFCPPTQRVLAISRNMRLRITRSSNLTMREQPHDDRKRDQADEAVLAEVSHHPHDVGDDAAEERDV